MFQPKKLLEATHNGFFMQIVVKKIFIKYNIQSNHIFIFIDLVEKL